MEDLNKEREDRTLYAAIKKIRKELQLKTVGSGDENGSKLTDETKTKNR